MTLRRVVPCLCLALAALAPPAPGAPEAPAVPMPEVRDLTLSNGMRFLLVRRGAAPVFFAMIGLKTGGVDEDLGASGLAHMCEHMALKGTRAIGSRDWAREKPLLDRIEQVGGGLTRLRAS